MCFSYDRSCFLAQFSAKATDWSGRLAQLVEHLVYTERVSGSSPLPPTSKHSRFRLKRTFNKELFSDLVAPSQNGKDSVVTIWYPGEKTSRTDVMA